MESRPLARGSALTRGFIQELDGLRGIAILMVMVHRFWPRTGVGVAADVAGAGWIGVDLFFVISGFLIAGILLDTKGDAGYFKNFYARRALRIFPLFYLFVIGVFIAFAHNPDFRERAGSPFWYLAHLGNVPEGLLGHDTPYWIAPTWSLAIEEQFYLTFPLLVYLLDRRRLTIVLGAMIVVAPLIRLATMLIAPEHERVQYLFTLCRIDTIAVGCLLAVIVRSVDVERWREHAKIGALALLPTVIALAVASKLDRQSPFDRVLGYSIVAAGCACVLALVILSRGTRLTSPLRSRPLTYLGKLCFGLYLLHRPADTIVSAIAARLDIHRELLLVPPKIAVAIGLATLSWRLVERPFLHLKDRFATARHPSAAATTERPRGWIPSFVARALRLVGILLVLLATACSSPAATDPGTSPDAGSDMAGGDGGLRPDGRAGDPDGGGGSDTGGGGDASVTASHVVYPEGVRHSPITPELAAHLVAIAGTGKPDVFAKIGDSITVSPDFAACFDGGTVDLAGRDDLAATIDAFLAGDAAGASPFARTSLAAKGGTTAADAMAGSPCPVSQELTAIAPQLAVVMFGTNENRYDWSFDAFGSHLWELVDATLAAGVIPILSTIPPNTGYAAADARTPTYNRVIRAIAQGRGLPLVDFHRELETLPGRGMSSDGLHPSVSPSGGCVLTAAGLQYGYNVRNLITLEALGRVRAALRGTAPDATAAMREGTGSESDPVRGTLPLVDLGDTHAGTPYVAHGCGAATGHQVAYRVTLAQPATIDAYLVDRDGTDVDVRIVAGGTCLAVGDQGASAVVPAGAVDVLVTAKSAGSEGEYVMIVAAR